MWICLLINEKGFGFLSGCCCFKLLKFIDFFKILGGVAVLSLPIENPIDSILLDVVEVNDRPKWSIIPDQEIYENDTIQFDLGQFITDVDDIPIFSKYE